VRAPALLALIVTALALAPAAAAAPGKVAVGIAPGTSVEAAADALSAATGEPVDRNLGELGALVVTVPDVDEARASAEQLPQVSWAEPVRRSRRLMFAPNDSYAFFQWYLTAIHAFDFWDTLPSLAPVRVAVIDSGIDLTNKDFDSRVASGRSFVKQTWKTDEDGHGTVVAGEIGASVDNSYGIAGVGFPAQLLVAKVVRKDGSVSVEDEAEAIRWAVDNGADVINLSLGGATYAALEQAAVNYAYANGVVVVAAAGNCDGAGSCSHAAFPAALPHVVGVGAIDQSDAAASFSDRDSRYVDLAAPGVQILSTFPAALTDPTCAQPGFNSCALPGRGKDAGTSFSAPLVSAAAALLLAQRPGLVASQVMALLQRSAEDLGPSGRDAATGAGLLDVDRALIDATAVPLPPADSRETSANRSTTNDDVPGAPKLYGNRPSVRATFDWYDDPEDVYRVYLRAGQRVTLRLDAPGERTPTIALWRPGTKHVTPITYVSLRAGYLLAHRRGASPKLSFRARASGWHFVDVKAAQRASGQYRLFITKG
jgi:subtilisin family serine protease